MVREIHGMLLISFAVLAVASVYPRAYSLKRLIVLVLPLVLIAYSWFWPWVRERRAVLTFVIALSVIGSLINILAVPKAQWREVTQYVDAQSQAGDVVLLVPTFMDYAVEYYSQGKLQLLNIKPAQAEKSLPEVAKTSRRLWLISHKRDIGDPNGALSGWLHEHGSRLEDVGYYNIRVELFEFEKNGIGN